VYNALWIAQAFVPKLNVGSSCMPIFGGFLGAAAVVVLPISKPLWVAVLPLFADVSIPLYAYIFVRANLPQRNGSG
jgi:hypothetical protein